MDAIDPTIRYFNDASILSGLSLSNAISANDATALISINTYILNKSPVNTIPRNPVIISMHRV